MSTPPNPAPVADDDDLGSRITEIESLCIRCGNNGTTRLIQTKIPFFREILLESFSCEHCGNRNTSVKSAGEIQELGSKYTLKVEEERDMERQVIRNDTAVFRIEDLGLEMPKGHSEINNVEGMLGKIHDELELGQPARKEQDYKLYTSLKSIIDKINRMRDGETFPFTISLDDPSGNSFIEPSPSDSDGKHQRFDYRRSHQQNVALGLASDETDEVEAAAASLNDLDIIDDRQYTLQEECPSCAKDCEVNIARTNIPHFKECIIFATVCDHCGYRTNDVKTGGEVPEKGRRITISIEKAEDLSRDILKSESCTLKSSELGLEVHPGTLGGRFTTVEGLLSQIRDQLYGQIFDAGFDDGAVASGDVKGGDSMASGVKGKWLEFFQKLEQARKAEMKYSIMLEDPLANSYVQSLCDPEPDPQIAAEAYERTEDEIDELGLKDMKTEGYEQDAEESEDEGEIPAVPSALHTTHGDIKIEIFCESVPKTAENFLALAAQGAYDSTPFHRIIPGFIVQGGDTSLSTKSKSDLPIPKGGVSIWGGLFEDEIRTPALRHNARGVVSMANKGAGTNGSQFFILLKEASHLDGNNTVFGKVLDGAQEGGPLDKIEGLPVDKKGRPSGEKAFIDRMTIHANPLAG